MMTDTQQEPIACKYVVLKYIPDLVRDEPINIGVIVQSQRNYNIVSEFITDFKFRHLEERLDINAEFLKEVTANIRESYLNRSDGSLFEKMNSLTKVFGGQVKITTPRVTLARDLNKEVSNLFETFISIKHLPTFEREITHKRILIDVYEYVSNYNSRIKKNVLVKGEKSSIDFSLGLLEESHFFQTISFDELQASTRAKILDWSIKDIISANDKIKEDNFGAIVARPLKANPRYEDKQEEFEQGMRILDNGKYNLVVYDKDSEAWKNKIKQLIP
ncbi:MAG: DUF3037 domain-containing protein [Nitrososphaerales archaeon]